MQKKHGFTIIEVLIFVTLLSLIFVSVSYIITNTLRNTKQNEYRIVATHYADELKEWLRGEKDVDWQALFSKAGTYCFNQTPITQMGTSGACVDFITTDGYGIFSRQVVITASGQSDTDQQISVDITVYWDNGTKSVKNNTVFTIYE
jgi:Tfp pilus assembly protein PilV